MPALEVAQLDPCGLLNRSSSLELQCWHSTAPALPLVKRMQPEIGYKGRTFIATGGQEIKSQTASQKVQMASILPT